ncbi:MAG: division/cell wall cluster transcriptional repressor MraZ [Candidatus Jacksonbacteria bacterium]|nr:division/cell wall cluster transcriptional repressor MraZ [Candidatus Jacksonbacteria bacterium]
MFIGEYQHTIDEKGRVAVPSGFRRRLTKGAVVTRGIDNCLFLYTVEEWKKLAQKVMNLPLGQAKSRAFARLMLAGAHEVSFDTQGRINLPTHLIDYARLVKKVVIAGLYNRIELWDSSLWEEYKKKAEAESEQIGESLGAIV